MKQTGYRWLIKIYTISSRATLTVVRGLSAYTHGGRVFIDSLKDVWNLHFNFGSERLSGEHYLGRDSTRWFFDPCEGRVVV